MKKLKNKKILKISLLIVIPLVIIGFLIYYFLLYNKKEVEIVFKLNGEPEITMLLEEEYKELGAILFVDGIDNSQNIIIDNKLDNKNIGKYEIVYKVLVEKKEYKLIRVINVEDKTKPEITLEGSNEITILTSEEFNDPGVKVSDNYDKLTVDDVKKESNLDTSKVGEYTIKYTISDKSGNTNSIERKVIVKEPYVEVVVEYEEKEYIPEVVVVDNANSITYNSFSSNGFYIEGYITNGDGSYKIKIVNNDDSSSQEYNMNYISDTNYSGNIDLSNYSNGNYSMYIISGREEKLNNKLVFLGKISRSRIGNKLITFSYDSDAVSFKVEDFSYQYDILIDVGHGGADSGAVNKYIKEADMNLKVSLYEKCRYEQHGLNVYITRTNSNEANLMGDTSVKNLYRRAYLMGYYSVVSKISYSNHHNSIGNSYRMGPEILVPSRLNYSELNTEHAIYNRIMSIYPITESHRRFYTRDNETDAIFDKESGEVYTFENYYAVIRIPFNLFNTKMVIYEGCYLSNYDDYNWYWNLNNWINISEIKIEEYVKSLGIDYNSDNTSCLN